MTFSFIQLLSDEPLARGTASLISSSRLPAGVFSAAIMC
jgi:hypothetical protein